MNRVSYRLLGNLLMVAAIYGALMASTPTAFTLENHQTLSRRLGFYGILTLGDGVLIVAGGIDLSIGSLIALGAVCFGLLLNAGVPPALSALLILAAAAFLGVCHGLLVTRLRLQPFLVTLCGLFIYRGLARWASGQTSVQLPLHLPGVDSLRVWLVSGNFLWLSNQMILLFLIAGILTLLLHASVLGRWYQAIGWNEQAARYAGIRVQACKISAYAICSALAGFAGVLFLLEFGTAQPSSAGQLMELYAITGAVLGGCSLRGGEGTVAGMLLGAAVLPLVNQFCNFNIGSDLEWTVIGSALLLGTILNELIRRRQRADW